MIIFELDIISDNIELFNSSYIIEIQEDTELGRGNTLSEVFYLEVVKNLAYEKKYNCFSTKKGFL